LWNLLRTNLVAQVFVDAGFTKHREKMEYQLLESHQPVTKVFGIGGG